MIEELLRESFSRHEALAPAAEQVRARVAAAASKRRRRRRLNVVGTAVALVALVAATLAAVDTVSPQPDTAAEPGRPITILLIGSDWPPYGEPHEDRGSRADSIVLAHLPADRGAAYLISIPRDETVGGSKFTDMYFAGGAPAVRSGVSARTGIAIDGVAELTITGLAPLVDVVGGVDLCVDVRVVSIHIPDQVYEPGCRHFTGLQATDYLRQRSSLPDGDYGRQRHNRDFLKALYAKLAHADPGQLLAAVRIAAGKALRIDLGIYQQAELIAAIRGLKPGDVRSVAPPATLDGLLPEEAVLWEAVRAGTLPDWIAANPEQVS
jgi:LCP family protein required for cell wall assembly